MKLFFIILSCFMLLLACLPCGDEDDCTVEEQTSIVATNDHSGHPDDAESCTPFCTCSCCSVSAFYSNVYKIQTSKVIFQSEKYPLYNIAFNTAVYYSVWHPPKIA